MAKGDKGYEQHKAAVADRERVQSQRGREIGRPPRIANVRRRARCRNSLRFFCETYNPDAFSLGWSDDHFRGIARIEEAAKHGALFAFAWPRGSGKTTLCRMAMLWTVSYWWRRYVFAIGANAEKAQDNLAAVKTYIRFLPLYAADFPDISWAAQCLGGIANRASGQLCEGQPTLIEWSQDRIVLPTVPPPENWSKNWPLRDDGMVPSSGSVIAASGLTGDGLRGSLLTLSTGESLRPDFVLLDDPQTRESAHSATQNATREQLVSADVLGMAGPGKTISAVMPCTVIAEGDFVDRILDRKNHPLWRGERTKLLKTMPTDLGQWDAYFEVYRRCAQKEPPDYDEANAHYEANRAAMDAGAEATWPARKLPWEVSAIQHAMHFYCRDERMFWAEYQNAPLPITLTDLPELVPEKVAARLNKCERGKVPAGMSRLTAFIDVQGELLFYLVAAWGEGFGGSVVDYGAWPKQSRSYFALRDANPTLASVTGIPSLEGRLYAGLKSLCDSLLPREFPMDGAAGLKIERCLIDSGWGMSTEVVERYCRQSGYPCLLPSKGIGVSAAMVPMSEWPRKEYRHIGNNWRIRIPAPGQGQKVLYDANHWKSFVSARLNQPIGEGTCLSLFGTSAEAHRLFADHCCAEYRVRTSGRGREVEEWKWRPHRPDNHWFDCLSGAAVAASVLGVQPAGMPAPAPKAKVSFAERQAKMRAGGGR